MLVRRGAESPADDRRPLETFRGVFHVHTVYSGDSEADLPYLVQKARRARLDYVVIADHNTLKGKPHYRPGGAQEPLLIFGVEHSRSHGKQTEGHLITFGTETMPPAGLTTQALIDWTHAHGGYAVLAHPFSPRTPWKNWDIQGLDGLEVYNFGHQIYRQNKLSLAFKAAFLTPDSFLRSVQQVPTASIETWREQWSIRGAAAFGASDAHLHFKWLGLTPENFVLYLRAVTMYVWAEAREERPLIEALGTGRSFFALDALGNAHGFVFAAVTGRDVFYPGNSVPWEPGLRFEIRLPQEGLIRIFRNGEESYKILAKKFSYEAEGPGSYHVEVYRDGKLWILANPIYVQEF